MKNLGIAICLVWILASCLPDKVGKKDSEPDLAGVYQMTSFMSDGVTVIPRAGVSGTVNVAKNSDAQISVSLSLTNNGKTTTGDSETVTISKSGGSTYDLIENNTRIGTIDGTTFALNYSDNTSSVSISAKK